MGFFQKHSTWYEKIPLNMATHPNSAAVILRLGSDDGPQVSGLPKIALNADKWSVPIFQASINDDLKTIGFLSWAWNAQDDGIYQESGDCAIAQEWNVNVRVPTISQGACGLWDGTPVYTDGSCVIISPDGTKCLEFNQFRNGYTGGTGDCGGEDRGSITDCAKMAQHDLTDDGIFDRGGSGTQPPCGEKGSVRIRAGYTPFLHGLVTYDEVAAGVIDHAIAFEYGGDPALPQFHLGNRFEYWYPCDSGNNNIMWYQDVNDPIFGYRFQLDPTLDVTQNIDNVWGPNPLSAGKQVVARAMQEYGLILVENAGSRNLSADLEDLEFDTGRSWSDAGVNIYSGSIWTRDLRLIANALTPPFTPVGGVIDNGDLGTTPSGTWQFSSGANPYGINSLYSNVANDSYMYTATGVDGDHKIAMWWTWWANRASSINVEIYDDTTLLDTVVINQSIQADAGKWNLLGAYTFTGIAKVKIISAGGDTTCADAVKIYKGIALPFYNTFTNFRKSLLMR